MSIVPSPAIAFIGRHNSGKTTIIVEIIAKLTSLGYDVGSVKHHSHVGFDIDIPGKDSYRHRAAGATETVISAPGQLAYMKTISGEAECAELVADMPGHDIVIVEGYRKSGIPAIEIMRAASVRDQEAARLLLAGEFGIDGTIGIATDMPEVAAYAREHGLLAFALGRAGVDEITAFLIANVVRRHVSVVIQAGGESRRMGQSKALVPFAGRPLICRLVERVLPAADELIITTNEAPRLEFLHEQYPEAHIRLVPDMYDFRGALPGICTALHAASNPFVATVACDMLFASARLIVAEAQVLHQSGADAVVPVNKHGYEPFHAIYRKDTCLDVVRDLVDSGSKKAQDMYSRIVIRHFTQAEVLRAEPLGGCFVNANTPEELHYLEESFAE